MKHWCSDAMMQNWVDVANLELSFDQYHIEDTPSTEAQKVIPILSHDPRHYLYHCAMAYV